ncbi:hypothetical protein SRHO_G00303710 [Serrasalmus rhombeus]
MVSSQADVGRESRPAGDRRGSTEALKRLHFSARQSGRPLQTDKEAVPHHRRPTAGLESNVGVSVTEINIPRRIPHCSSIWHITLYSALINPSDSPRPINPPQCLWQVD